MQGAAHAFLVEAYATTGQREAAASHLDAAERLFEASDLRYEDIDQALARAAARARAQGWDEVRPAVGDA